MSPPRSSIPKRCSGRRARCALHRTMVAASTRPRGRRPPHGACAMRQAASGARAFAARHGKSINFALMPATGKDVGHGARRGTHTRVCEADRTARPRRAPNGAGTRSHQRAYAAPGALRDKKKHPHLSPALSAPRGGEGGTGARGALRSVVESGCGHPYWVSWWQPEDCSPHAPRDQRPTGNR